MLGVEQQWCSLTLAAQSDFPVALLHPSCSFPLHVHNLLFWICSQCAQQVASFFFFFPGEVENSLSLARACVCCFLGRRGAESYSRTLLDPAELPSDEKPS